MGKNRFKKKSSQTYNLPNIFIYLKYANIYSNAISSDKVLSDQADYSLISMKLEQVCSVVTS